MDDSLRMRMFADIPIFEYQSVDSTQEQARTWLKENSQETGVFALKSVHRADTQTNGRGRRGKVWLDQEGASLLCTFIVSPISENNWLEVAKVMLSAREVLENIGVPASIKWPNDLIVDGEKEQLKLAGCLTELEGEFLLVGLGINLGIEHLDDELKSTAVGVEDFNVFITPNELLDRIIEAYLSKVKLMTDIELIEDFRRSCLTIGSNVNVKQINGEIFGLAKTVNEDGSLSVETENGDVTIFEGEINSLRKV